MPSLSHTLMSMSTYCLPLWASRVICWSSLSRNSGSRDGDEVAQLYTHQLVTSVTTYEKNLRGFERIHLNAGETKTVTFTLKPEDLSLWNRQMRFVVEPGKFKVMIGSGSEDIRLTGQFEMTSQ